MPRGSGRFERISDEREYTPQHFILEGFRNPGLILIGKYGVGRNGFGGPTFRPDTQLCIRMAPKVCVRTRFWCVSRPGAPSLRFLQGWGFSAPPSPHFRLWLNLNPPTL